MKDEEYIEEFKAICRLENCPEVVYRDLHLDMDLGIVNKTAKLVSITLRLVQKQIHLDLKFIILNKNGERAGTSAIKQAPR